MIGSGPHYPFAAPASSSVGRTGVHRVLQRYWQKPYVPLYAPAALTVSVLVDSQLPDAQTGEDSSQYCWQVSSPPTQT